MSGPVTTDDAPAEPTGAAPSPACVEITESHEAVVGSLTVRRALPRRARRTVGAWCFVDHMGPVAITEDQGVDIGPHPHIGLQTVTWLLAGEVLHRDSLGSEQLIRPGQLNLMTAGRGVVHAEEHTGRYRGDLHGVQLWVAQPEATRHADAAFEHHAELPALELDSGTATVLVGQLGGTRSHARRDTDHFGASLALQPGGSSVPLDPRHEHAIVVLDGAALVDDQVVTPGHLAYLGTGRDELAVEAREPTTALLLGGKPFESPVLMWWNFVARTREEASRAWQDWDSGSHRFGPVDSRLPRIAVGPPPWLHP
jgi:redox-sensitive bicupin YhaK (pirin superfamily)